MSGEIQARDGATLDYIQLWDSGCVKTRLNQLTQAFISKLALEQTHREALKARKKFRTYEGFKLPKGKNIEEVYGKQARKEAERILEEERKAFVRSREKRLLDRLTVIRDRLRVSMFAVDQNGEIVKPTFVHRTVETGGSTYTGDYVSFFATDKDSERMKSINALNKALSEVAYMIPYSSKEVLDLWNEIATIRMPDHYENWHNDQPIQIYGGRYAEEDRGLERKVWLKKVRKRAKELTKEKASQ